MVTATAVKWVGARCSECKQIYKHPEGFKLVTCGAIRCLLKYLHPELSTGNPVK